MRNTKSADDARILLIAAENGVDAGSSVSRSTAGTERLFTLVVGTSVSLFLLSVVYVYPLGNPLVTVAVTLLYGAAITVAVLMFARLRRGSSAGWSRRYVVGFLGTMLLYVAGVLLFSATSISTPVLWVPYAIITALPVIVASFVTSRR